jgi:transposase
MFVRTKKSGKWEYLQIVENHREGKKVKQRVIGTIGRLDEIKKKGSIESLIKSLSRYSEEVILVLTGKSKPESRTRKIGPGLIFDRIWEELKIKKIIRSLLHGRKYEYDLERAIFVTVLHRIMRSGSDRSCEKWQKDYVIKGIEEISLHHLYRAMTFIGEEIENQKDKSPFSPRCNKDMIEEGMFSERRDLFTGLSMVFFDTTSIYFEGKGGKNLGKRGHSKDHRPDLNQIVVGTTIDDSGKPICCEILPGNTADIKTLIPVVDRIKGRFNISNFCIVADRGMISAETKEALDSPTRKTPYILGARMRLINEIKFDVLSRGGNYSEVYPESKISKDPSPLKVKEVKVGGKRYIVCVNTKQARKDEADRKNIIESLHEQLKKDPKLLIGNKGYRKYLKIDRDSVMINEDKINAESRFDGKWVLETNTNLTPAQVALKYKELWQVEQVFRDIKSIFITRPVFHRCDETIRGHVFCSFLALVLKKELDRRLETNNLNFEWADIKHDLKALQEIIIKEGDKQISIRTQCVGSCGKIFQAVGVAMPPVIHEF